MDKYNTKLSQLGGLFTQTASEIMNDPELKTGEKFLLLQRLVADIAPATKTFEKVKKDIEKRAKEMLLPNGEKQSETIEIEGAEVLIKYAYPPDTLDANKLEEALQQAYAEIGSVYKQERFTKPSTIRQTVIIQSILD